MNRIYICIDLKTFYASVECVERKLNPFTTNLIVADKTRGKGTICLAISPRMKMLGIKNRCRVFEIPDGIDYIIARPRMEKYIEYSVNIYEIYLKYFDPKDIHVYSIDEAFMDVTEYLKLYNKTPVELAKAIMQDIMDNYGITATAGIGTNLYLAKIALDIMSKHNVTNIGYLDEERYKEKLWYHKPLSDFWQIGKGIEKRLNRMGIFDMCALANFDERRLYKEFGINAKLLIDHSKGIETCTMKEIKEYKPKSNSLSTNQVLFKDYNYEDAKMVVKEMVELLSLDLIKAKQKTDSISLYVGYSNNVIEPSKASMKLENATDTYTELSKYFIKLYEKIVNRTESIRRIGITFSSLSSNQYMQLNLFEDSIKKEKEERLENTINIIKNRMGKNSLMKGINLEENATTLMRNNLIGGHNAS